MRGSVHKQVPTLLQRVASRLMSQEAKPSETQLIEKRVDNLIHLIDKHRK